MKYGGGIDDLLGKVVVKSLSLVADADASVRRECAKFIGLLLQNTPPVSQLVLGRFDFENYLDSKFPNSITTR